MGMYTELYFATKLSKDTPQTVLDLIERAISGQVQNDLPAHRFFACERWTQIFYGGGSYYFDAPCHQQLWPADSIDGCRHILILVNLKNYGGEIEAFLNWISPYVDGGGHVGHMRYEEDDVPTLLELPWDWMARKMAGPIRPMAQEPRAATPQEARDGE